MDTWRVVMMTSAAILILVGLLGSLIMWAWRRSARIRESERLNKLELTIINALERSGYKMYGGLKLRADPVNKTFTLVGRYASQTFHVDKVDSGRWDEDWRIFVYNNSGERRLMDPSTYELHLLEVRDEHQRRKKEVGFDNPTADSPSVEPAES
jgi:hypothetical protein